MTNKAVGLSALMCGVSVAAMAAATPSAAQAPPASRVAALAPEVSEVVVTGTHLQNGFTTPTPVTVATVEQLRQAAPGNLADGLAELPVFSGNVRTGVPASTANSGGTGGANGQNLLSMRGLGARRNLVLLDGQRLPTTNFVGAVDVNVLPQKLVTRVDIVTGGASAAYGADAVAGVVNFVLDKRFIGLKGELQTGISTYGDLAARGASLAGGRSFAGGRGHIIASAEYFAEDGLDVGESTGRTWFDRAAGRIPNPAGQPTTIIVPNLRSSISTYGGLISAGPLANTQFLPGGVSAPFVQAPAAVRGATFSSGGDGAATTLGFSPEQDRYNAFSHLEYELTDRLTINVEGIYAYSHANSANQFLPHVGTANQFTIFRDNAYLPADILQRMIAANVQSFALGRTERDFGAVEIESKTELKRFAGSFDGKLERGWTWDVNYTFGQTKQELRQNNLSISRNLYAAADAVRSPSGQIVCRSTLAGLDPGCVPLNLFGEGSPSAAAIDFVNGDAVKWLTIEQQVVTANIHGDLGERFQLGAGPIAVAAGLEYRTEKADQTSDAISQSIVDFAGVRGGPASKQNSKGGFQAFNPLPLGGGYNVKEAFLELGVPILRDRPLARTLDLNAAARRADFSLSGAVTAWKLGLIYEPNEALRFRVTRSQDVRGANLQELFNSSTSASNNTTFRGRSYQALTISSGNTALKPEIAKTLTYGVVIRPPWVPGLQASVDRYTVDIRGAIAVPQRIPQRCDEGNLVYCSLITITPQDTLIIRSQSINLSSLEVAGYDLELSYRRPALGGDLSFRLLANHITRDQSALPGGTPNSDLGSAGSPRWRGTFQTRYSRGRAALFIQQRYIGKAKLDPALVEGIGINDNSLPRMLYTTIGGTYSLSTAGGSQELFFTVNNLFNTSPPASPEDPTSYNGVPVNGAYDRVGRYFTAGVRFKW